MECEDVIKKINEGQSDELHFIEGISSIVDVFKGISAFGNTAGGNIIIGVKPNGKVVGVNPDEVEELIFKYAESYGVPLNNFEMGRCVVGRHYVYCINVPTLKSKIGIIEDSKSKQYYLRINKQFVPASKIHRLSWKLLDSSSKKMEEDVKDQIIDLCRAKGNLSLSKLYTGIKVKNSIIDYQAAELLVSGRLHLIYINEGWLIMSS